MKKTVVALIKDDPEIEKACSNIDERQKMFEQQLEFYNKKIKNEHQQMEESNKQDWGIILSRLQSQGKVKNYKEPRNNLVFSVEENAVYLEDHDECCGGDGGPSGFFGGLFRK